VPALAASEGEILAQDLEDHDNPFREDDRQLADASSARPKGQEPMPGVLNIQIRSARSTDASIGSTPATRAHGLFRRPDGRASAGRSGYTPQGNLLSALPFARVRRCAQMESRDSSVAESRVRGRWGTPVSLGSRGCLHPNELLDVVGEECPLLPRLAGDALGLARDLSNTMLT
jgi:hypothetical protein